MDTVKLHFKRLGEGFPVIILHGLFGMLDNWKTIGKALSEEYQVFLVDLRNHGRSPHSDAFGIEEMCADIRQFMDDQWIYEAFLIGHSMGGKVAMKMALDDPGRIEKLVVVDIAPKAYDRKHDTIIDALCDLDPGKYNSRGELDDALANDIGDEAVRMFLLKNVRRSKNDGFTWRNNMSVIAAQYERILEAVTGNPYPNPACFISGGKSNYIKSEDKAGITKLFPGAQFVRIDDAGHWVHAESPDRFLAEVRQFLSSS